MTELNKLFTSLILLGGGFFAASLIGPPEVIDRLSRYLRPSGVDVGDGLRPLAANTPASTPETATGWPALAPTAPAATGPAPTGPLAAVAAMVPPSTWPGEAPTPTVAPSSPWDTAGPSSPEAAPPSPDWLTSESFAAPTPAAMAPAAIAPSLPPQQALTPVPRSGVPASTVNLPTPDPDQPGTPEADGWPELRAPLPPMAGQDFGATGPREVTVAKPALQANPYEARPRFDAASTGFDSDRNPLRYEASAGQSIDPIQRRPSAGDSFVQHIVTDGDTLPAIAQRYLGDASRAQELFELNRDRLQHPDVLPIGMVLKAPKSRAVAQPAAPSISATSIGYPHLERPGDFSTVSASEAYLPPVATAQRRPLTAIGSTADRPLTDEQRLGPVDAVYQQEFAWDANGW